MAASYQCGGHFIKWQPEIIKNGNYFRSKFHTSTLQGKTIALAFIRWMNYGRDCISKVNMVIGKDLWTIFHSCMDNGHILFTSNEQKLRTIVAIGSHWKNGHHFYQRPNLRWPYSQNDCIIKSTIFQYISPTCICWTT